MVEKKAAQISNPIQMYIKLDNFLPSTNLDLFLYILVLLFFLYIREVATNQRDIIFG
jgi:hypothetical protein